VSEWRVVFTRQARKDAQRVAASDMKERAAALIAILREDPYRSPPPFDKLVGDLAGAYSRPINVLRRLVYQVLDEERAVKVIRMWTHYE